MSDKSDKEKEAEKPQDGSDAQPPSTTTAHELEGKSWAQAMETDEQNAEQQKKQNAEPANPRRSSSRGRGGGGGRGRGRGSNRGAAHDYAPDVPDLTETLEQYKVFTLTLKVFKFLGKTLTLI